MSDYPSYPPPPPPDGPGGYGQPIRTEPPPSINTSMNIIWAALALQVISTILSFVFLDDLLEAAGINPGDADVDAARTGALIGAVVGFVIFGGLWVLFGVFMRKGANWARIVLTVLAALGLIFGVVGVLGEQPVIFLILGLVQMALYVALLYFMWRPESSAYLTGQRA